MDYKKLSDVRITDSKKELTDEQKAKAKKIIDSVLKKRREALKKVKISDSEDLYKEFYKVSEGEDYITKEKWEKHNDTVKFEDVDFNKDGKVCFEDFKKFKVEDSAKPKHQKFADFKVTDGYKDLSKKIKDALEETETTEDAIDVVIDLLEEQPAEQVVAATVEVLGAAIDVLEEHLDEHEEIKEEIKEEPEHESEEVVEEEIKED